MNQKMRIVTVVSLKNQCKIADRCSVAESALDRLRGLIGKKVFEKGEGLLLSPCNDIHMWMMSIPIDVVFLAMEYRKSNPVRIYRVTSIRENLQPWKLFPVHDRKANLTLELPIGTIRQNEILPGDDICIS